VACTFARVSLAHRVHHSEEQINEIKYIQPWPKILDIYIFLFIWNSFICIVFYWSSALYINLRNSWNER